MDNLVRRRTVCALSDGRMRHLWRATAPPVLHRPSPGLDGTRQGGAQDRHHRQHREDEEKDRAAA
ncbi:hypothetical protein BJI69_16245 [Luteibacter rhizovicinus DSM 16549]|uniref:Uncharacterized protein n=1 Tax=Luteibacter rhizovicinus DSM 16549 TaxID=1440763 RepID=A0A0G9HEF4_9GAMM|nr:hypothetical protein BJI69_16245 [Luteibacter rhizovicinus DSM 16549]KLD67916.1 hypothetical protein Y883_05920 [Luteibacter rhizovicinus DSM 16549]